MFSRINYWLYSSIFGYFIINLFLKNVTQVCARKEIDPSIKYQQALRDYSIFQSIKCNGKFDYRVFERIDRICYDCFNLFQEPRLYSQCSVLSKNVWNYNDQDKRTTPFTPYAVPDRIDRKIAEVQAKYDGAINDYKIFQSLKCNGRFNYKVFAEINEACDDCQNLLNRPEFVLQCRNECFINSFFDGCMEMLLLNMEELEDIKEKRWTLNDPSINGSIILPTKPELEKKSIWRKIYENMVVCVLSKNVWKHKDQNRKTTFIYSIFTPYLAPYPVDRKKSELLVGYRRAIDDYKKFQSLKCKGLYNYEVFARLDKICKDCQNVFKKHPLYLQCSNNCFKNEFFDGCMEMLFFNDTKACRDAKNDRLKLRVYLPFVDRSIVLPQDPPNEQESAWVIFIKRITFQGITDSKYINLAF
ncbi:hypothetical protein HCN44_001047 [Aphidius gifuensis]|uniref:Uncharacterized protein n=1 Tax=Aphidius gifuensis TaxID=684658 RepID=A0A835CMJ8_APHGI|nr:hypothetical protein HCN44_001047 [Aphidius gifuensis]